jgi:hypothetical protein
VSANTIVTLGDNALVIVENAIVHSLDHLEDMTLGTTVLVNRHALSSCIEILREVSHTALALSAVVCQQPLQAGSRRGR